jgi:hypothetical protein
MLADKICPHQIIMTVGDTRFELTRYPLPAPVILDSLPPGRRRTSAHADRRARPEWHNPHSIATLRIVLARLLLRQLP